jgi:hypothetical protein
MNEQHKYSKEDNQLLSTTLLIHGVNKGFIKLTISYFNYQGYISNIRYCEKRSIKGLLKRDKGSIDMLNTLLSYIKNNYYPKNVLKVTFDDDCQIFSNFGEKIELKSIHYLIYGKTWYEKHFNAQPYFSHSKQHYLTNIEKINSKIELSFREFLCFLPVFYYSEPRVDLTHIETIYNREKEKGSDWKTLFNELGTDIMYNCLGERLNRLHFNLYMPRNWEIYLDDFNVIDYTQTPVVENFVSNIVIKYLDD